VKDDSTLIFLHIGKTAGTTLRRILRKHYPASQTLVVRARQRPREETLSDFAALPEAERARPRLILGHTVYGLHESVPRPATYISMLRRPTSLVLSQYSFVLRTPGHRHHQDAQGMSLEDYLRSGLAQEMNNSQTRAIAGAVDVPYGENPPELLEQAKRHIEEHFSVVGLTERFDESLVAMKMAFGWSKINYVRANVASKKVEPSSEARALIDELNTLDNELYRWTDELFTSQITATPGFAEEYARFQRRNRLYGPWGTLTYTFPKRLQTRFLPQDGVRR
jgi:Galactose-3-O-sulfotransferase